MPEPIGFQDGIAAYFNWYRQQPRVPQRGPNYDPNNPATWPWPDKLEHTFESLKDGHNEVWKDGGLAARVSAIEEGLPFPFRASSTAPGA